MVLHDNTDRHVVTTIIGLPLLLLVLPWQILPLQMEDEALCTKLKTHQLPVNYSPPSPLSFTQRHAIWREGSVAKEQYS